MAVGVTDGSRRDPMLQADSSNATHGLLHASADKRKAVGALLADPEWSTWSDREITRRCAVGHPLVAEVRRLTGISSSDGPADRIYKTKHGSKATMKVPMPAIKNPTATMTATPAPSPEPVKQAAAAAAEVALNDDEMPTAADEAVPDVDELLEETKRLYDQIEVLTSGSDDKAESAKWHRLYEDASRKAIGARAAADVG